MCYFLLSVILNSYVKVMSLAHKLNQWRPVHFMLLDALITFLYIRRTVSINRFYLRDTWGKDLFLAQIKDVSKEITVTV